MIQVIQTNQSLNVFGQERDFQSFIRNYNFPYTSFSEWETFKDWIIRGNRDGFSIKNEPIEIIIDDDFHLEVLYKEDENTFSKSQFYLVRCNNDFKREYECKWV